MSGGPGKATFVNATFASIARRYDLMNRIMSAGQDQLWRRRALALLGSPPGSLILDVGTGTGDFLPLLVGAGYRAIGVDFCFAMLQAGQGKLSASDSMVAVTAGDARHLPFADGQFDGVINAFLLRNVEDLPGVLAELRRVVRRGGRLVCLEITWPTLPVFRQAFSLYFGRFVPLVGGLVTGEPDAYAYLPRSVAAFVSAPRLAELLLESGWRDVTYRQLALGTIAIHSATK